MLHSALLTVFLALPAQDAGIPPDTEMVTTDSGLTYSVLEAGEGKSTPVIGDRVQAHFTGWLADGTRFETTRGGQAAVIEVGSSMAGLNEGLQLMRAGSRYKFTVPPELAYKAIGRPPQIPPNATLIFEVEVLEVLALPRFRKAGEQTATPSGLRYESVRPGDGEDVSPNHVVVVRYALWNPEGTLIDCSERNGDHRLKSKLRKVGEFKLLFLEEALALMSRGATYRFEVPPELCFEDGPPASVPKDSITIWELELEEVLVPLPVPSFEEFDPDRLEQLESGLEHYVVRKGEGRAPEVGDEVTLSYVGWLVNGKVFDDSYSMGEPAVMRMRKPMIQGLIEGLGLVQEGGVHVFRIPSDLAYGGYGSPPYIGPQATLIFRVELLEAAAR